MNIFLDETFSYNDLLNDKNQKSHEELLANHDFTEDDLIELLVKFDKLDLYADVESFGNILYYFMRMDIVKDKIGYTPNPDSEYIMGTFKDSFYNKLYSKLNNAKKFLFPFLPGHLQKESMLEDYFTDRLEASFANWKNPKAPSEKTLLKLLDVNFVAVVRTMKPEWWTKKIKDKAISVNEQAKLFIPANLISKKEIIESFRSTKDIGKVHAMFRTLDNEFKEDQEIRAEYALIVYDSRIDTPKPDFYSSCKPEFFEIFLHKVKPTLTNNKFWLNIPRNVVNKKLINLLIEKMPYEAIKYIRDLDKTQLKAIYNNAKKIKDGAKYNIVQIINRMFKEGLFKVDMLDDFGGLSFEDLKYALSDSDLKLFMTPEVVDWYFEKEDVTMFSTKQSMKYAGKLDIKKFYTLMKHLSFSRLKSRINFNLDTDDNYAYLYLTKEHDSKLSGNDYIVFEKKLDRLVREGFMSPSSKLITLLEDFGHDITTYEDYLLAVDLFLL